MKKPQFPLSFYCLISSFLLLPVVKAGSNTSTENRVVTAAVVSEAAIAAEESAAMESRAMAIYEELGLDRLGLNQKAMIYAYKGFQKLAKSGKLDNTEILTVCDFTQPSTSKRMYILDIRDMKVLVNTFVAHGKNSGLKYAERFSNRHESLQSSLGFYVTKNTYFGKHGLSLRMAGVDRGFNDNAESRAVVVHGANYIGANRLGAAYMGRSFGCPAVPQHLSAKVIKLIKNGTCLFIYHPSQNYLKRSTVLNG
ncbi:MAG TPA: murein L,D-transpeptidase catalytic domain family protein [Flavisolibacter sp.]